MSCNNCAHKKRCPVYAALQKMLRDAKDQFKWRLDFEDELFRAVAYYCKNFTSYYELRMEALRWRYVSQE